MTTQKTEERKITYVDPEKLKDNPFQARHYYNPNDIQELADSIDIHGLRQFPEAREKDGEIELAYGHKRKRAFIKLKKKKPKKWPTMPVIITDISDEDMFYYVMEENARRGDITPIDTARGIDHFLTTFPKIKEQEVADKLKMTQGNVSNMRRVLRLPADVLAKVDEGKINFTMARELLVFQDVGNGNIGITSRYSNKEQKYVEDPKDARYLMLQAIRNIGGNMYGSCPATVDGMKKSIFQVASANLRALEQEGSIYRSAGDPLFDTRAAGCLKCKDSIITYETKTRKRHYCVNFSCWDEKQQAHKDEQARLAREKMTADVLDKIGQVEVTRVQNADISQEISEAEESSKGVLDADNLEAVIEEIDKEDEQEDSNIPPGMRRPGYELCQQCLNATKCDGTGVYSSEEDDLVCDSRVTKENFGEITKQATIEIPEELRDKVSAAAGTRAEILDLDQLRLGSMYNQELKAGHVNLTNVMDIMDDPEECYERCITGFHYAFDSRNTTGQMYYICTNPKCCSKKKAAFTRMKNAQGLAKKKAEIKAIQAAVDKTGATLDPARLMLIIKVQLEKLQQRGWFGDKKFSVVEWWMNKLEMQPEPGGNNIQKILIICKSLGWETLAKLVVESMLVSLQYEGDLSNYKIQTAEPLGWMGISPQVEKVDKKEIKQKGAGNDNNRKIKKANKA